MARRQRDRDRWDESRRHPRYAEDASSAGDEIDERFPPADWRGESTEHEAARRARPYRWPFVKEPFYDGDDALYGPYGYGGEETSVEERATPGARRARAWRALERSVPTEAALAYPEYASDSPEEARFQDEWRARMRRFEDRERRSRRARSMGRHFHFGMGPKGYRRSDDRIRDEIADRLAEDPLVDPSDVELEVKDGEVTLTGTVADRWTKHEVENVAETVLGVQDIHNQIRVRRDELKRS